jgi:hypothetical protein
MLRARLHACSQSPRPAQQPGAHRSRWPESRRLHSNGPGPGPRVAAEVRHLPCSRARVKCAKAAADTDFDAARVGRVDLPPRSTG